MTIDARTAILSPGEQQLDIVDVDLPDPGRYEVIVKHTATGVCPSQLHQINNTARTGTLVLGHESVGRVVAVGADLDAVAPGDEVLVSWMPRDAIAIADDSTFGLIAAIFGDFDEALAIAARLETGAVAINGDEPLHSDAPSGGWRLSGVGREQGEIGVREFVELVTVQWPVA